MKYHFTINKDKKYYWAQCIELEGCITQGTSLEDLRVNMSEALNLYLKDASTCEHLFPMPDKKIRKNENIEEVAVFPDVAFPILMKYYRIEKYKLTQSEVAKKLGMQNVYSYQRLEEKKCNPTLKILAKIIQVFPEFSVDYAISS